MWILFPDKHQSVSLEIVMADTLVGIEPANFQSNILAYIILLMICTKTIHKTIYSMNIQFDILASITHENVLNKTIYTIDFI